ncbi:MAG: TlpA family protein disulfide reductase [Flavobacteriaceae bacterium]|nr:TlpA family protein disulfide reductase [Flavobacteriaceae bacterium]
MKIRIILIITLLAFVGCTGVEPFTEFSVEAKSQKIRTTSGEEITFGELLNQYKGKTIVVDIWASWCKDCIKGMPTLKALQHNDEAKDVVFLFLSMDKTYELWLNGIARFKVEGENYFLGNDWEAPFNRAIGLDWIPRYMVIGKDGKVKVFKAIKADDSAILKAIKSDK